MAPLKLIKIKVFNGGGTQDAQERKDPSSIMFLHSELQQLTPLGEKLRHVVHEEFPKYGIKKKVNMSPVSNLICVPIFLLITIIRMYCLTFSNQIVISVFSNWQRYPTVEAPYRRSTAS